MDRERRVICLSTNWPDFRLQAGIVAYAQQHAWQIVNLDHSGSRVFPLEEVHGLIGNLGGENSRHLLERVERWTCPLVNLFISTARWARGFNHGYAIHDNHTIGRLGAEHFLHLGFRHLAYHRATPYPSPWRHSNLRYEGFSATAQAAGVDVHGIWGRADRDRVAVVEQVRSLPKPCAVLCENDFVAMALCDLCRKYHITVPDEVAVCGIENDPLICPNNIPPLTSIDVNREEQGYRAAELLDRLIDGEPPGDPIEVPPLGVVARRSTDHVAIDNPHVSRALTWIRDHYQEPVGADDVVAAAGCGRTTLYREFQRHFGHSIAVEIAHRRIQRACYLLAGSDKTLATIAANCGFSSPQHLSRSFLRDKGITPSTFRLRARSHDAVIERDSDEDQEVPSA